MFTLNQNLSEEYRYTRLGSVFVISIITIITFSILTYNKFYFAHIEKMSEQGYEQVVDGRSNTGTLWVKKGASVESSN